MFMKNIISLLFILVFISCASDQRKKSEKKAILFYNQGTQELADKEYTIALTHLQQANQLLPENTHILNNLGMAFYFKGAEERAVRTIKRALEIDRKNTAARMNLATIEMKRKNFKQAEKLYLEILNDLNYPTQFKTYYNLGVLSQENGNESEAFSYYKKALQENESYCPAHQKLGDYYFKRRNLKKALSSYNEASFGTCYNSPLPHFRQAKTLIEMKNYPKATESLTLIMEKFSSTKYFNLARLELRKVEKLQSMSNRENSSGEFDYPGRKILTPDF